MRFFLGPVVLLTFASQFDASNALGFAVPPKSQNVEVGRVSAGPIEISAMVSSYDVIIMITYNKYDEQNCILIFQRYDN